VIAAKLRLEPSRSFNPLLLVVFFPLIVLVHEDGHAAAALLVGHRVLEVKIGVGPSVSVWPVGAVWCSACSRWPDMCSRVHPILRATERSGSW
jgi:hypothetical protein